MKKNAYLFAVAATILAMGVTAIASQNIQPSYAQVFDNGASGLAPGQIVGPDAPGETDATSPGKIVGPDAPGQTDEISTGLKALDVGIIGPKKSFP